MGIKMKPSEIPERRRNDPKRRAEAEVFDALVNLGRDGRGIYEFRYRPDGQQVDYLIWLDDLARIAGQVKGGTYREQGGQWDLRSLEGRWDPKPSPVEETVDGRIEMHDAIEKATGYYTFVAGVLFLPDMKRDPDMEELALNRDSVHIVWGLDHLERDLERIAELVQFRRPPKPSHSRNEWQQVYDLQRQSGDESRPSERRSAAPRREPVTDVPMGAEQGLRVGNATFNIAHVEHLHLGPPELPEG